MARKKKKKKLQQEAIVDVVKQPKVPTGFWYNSKAHKIIIFLFACLLYANTLSHDYTQDDAIVIYNNMFTEKGVAGIPGLLTNDTFFGFFKVEGKTKLVSGGRYRPFTPVMFAIEREIFGDNPFFSHLFSVLYYALLCVLLYMTLEMIFLRNGLDHKFRWMIFMATMLFVAHPIHTEVVANIKGRDEIMTLMGALLATYAAFKYHYSKQMKWLAVILVSFFLALMSKENAITFLAVVPLALLFFAEKSSKNLIPIMTPFLLATLFFLGIRTSILGLDFGGTPMELMNNPYLKLEGTKYVPFDFGERLATIIYTLGKYIQLLVFPHPLTNDYYPRHIDIKSFMDWQVLLSLLGYIALVVGVFYNWKKNKLVAFSIAFYLITLSIVSNVVFPIGTNMSERFMFMPSIGFVLLLSYGIHTWLGKSKNFKLMLIALLVFLFGYSLKTITRNMVWKDDFTLFTTDVKVSNNSAKSLNAAGGALSTEYWDHADENLKKEKLNLAIGYLNKATKIHPGYKNAFLLLGNSHYYLKNYDESIKNYQLALNLDPSYQEANKNMAVSLRDAARYTGEHLKNYPKAKEYLQRSYAINSTDYETVRLLGITSGLMNNHKDAIRYFEEVIVINPNVAQTYASLGTAYLNYGDEEQARINFNKAIEIDPKVMNNLKK